MQPVAGKVEGLRRRGLIETCKNILHRFEQIRAYLAPIIALIEAFQTPMLETSNHRARL